MAIRGIIFDKDGTLFDYAEVWGPTIKEYAKTILMTFDVRNQDEARQRIYEIVGIDDKGNSYPEGFLFNHDHIVRIFFKILAFCIHNRISPWKMYRLLMKLLNSKNRQIYFKLKDMDFSPVQKLMKALKDDGMTIGLVTNDITANTKVFLDLMGIAGYVSFLRTKESNCKGKPNDESIRQFSSLFWMTRDEICLVGDSIVDMEYARRGRVGYTVAVLTGYGLREKLEEYADVVYDRIEDLASDPVLFPKRT